CATRAAGTSRRSSGTSSARTIRSRRSTRRSRSRSGKTNVPLILAGFTFAAAVRVPTPPLPPPPPDNRDIQQEALPGMVSRKYLTPPPAPTVTPAPPQIVGPDGRSVDAIVEALYQSVSCGPEVEPNWERMRAVFLPGAKIVPPRGKNDAAIVVLDGTAFQDRVKKLLAAWKEKGESTALYENETARQEQCFGNVCQVFSTFETRHAPGDPKPIYRGIHS